MGSTDVIDLSSDEEEQPTRTNHLIDFQDFKFLVPLASVRGDLEGPPGIFNTNGTGTGTAHLVKKEVEELSTSLNGGSNLLRQAGSPSAQNLSLLQPICHQFWKSGDYEVKKSAAAASQNGRNRLRINPRFLHSNATSHKWAFGAIAELLDNAIDEVNNGATFVRVDKFISPRDCNPALLVQDDGGGMDPESLRRCLSFGFSDKKTESFIGQYGNGFKTSTMRLGADVIVFTRHKKNTKEATLSVGLLSYTFLTRTGCDDIVVPTVNYEFDTTSGSLKRLIRINEKQFSSNLSMLLKWSPFASEDELCRQFDGIGDHGTKIIVYNLWHNDDGNMELDFNSDSKDIVISGARKPLHHGLMNKDRAGNKENLTQKNVATRLRYSLRAYASILYLRMPGNFKITLRGEAVEPHLIANDLMYRECILYRPNVGGITGAAVVTTIGYVIGAPNVDVEGFNIYHKNRLISPFLKVASNSYGKGRGVIGVLEANFVKPTHDKQDFEKSVLFQRLETRLKEMTYEYWDLHCHRVGYDNKKLPKNVRESYRLQAAEASPPLDIVTTGTSTPLNHTSSPKSSSQAKMQVKRKHGAESFDQLPKTYDDDSNGDVIRANLPKKQKSKGVEQFHETNIVMLENKKLHEQCAEYEREHRKLLVKEQMLRSQLEVAKREFKEVLDNLQALAVKKE
ncbi:MORC family CW-type zinc finger protein 4 [Carex littledalei]|uniref:MORC family CW-type zinc finger protein 4 n=1 Tax=Carex littledalei TaxID=544730 RepID=A0A833V287_9POAL|nr:MORC family CW-type zinc finger protein 4 [Carex littledalei]